MIPKICCPQGAIAAPKESEMEKTTAQRPQTSTDPPTTPYVPLNDEDRYFQHTDNIMILDLIGYNLIS